MSHQIEKPVPRPKENVQISLKSSSAKVIISMKVIIKIFVSYLVLMIFFCPTATHFIFGIQILMTKMILLKCVFALC